MLVDDESTTLEQLNGMCGSKHDRFFGAKIFKKHLLVEMQASKIEETEDRAIGFASLDVMKEGSS
jgi:hypothetical protein